MIKRTDYFKIKHDIREMCKDTVLELCDKVGLNEYETNLVIHINKDDTRVCTALNMGTCTSKISKDLKRVIAKINDYLKRQQ